MQENSKNIKLSSISLSTHCKVKLVIVFHRKLQLVVFNSDVVLCDHARPHSKPPFKVGLVAFLDFGLYGFLRIIARKLT